MAMQTVYSKDNEGVVSNNNINSTTIGQLSGPSGPWWSNNSYGESYCAQLNKSFSLEQPGFVVAGGRGGGLAAKPAGIRGVELGLETNHFNIFSGDGKFSGDGQKSLGTISVPEYNGRFELGFGPPMVCTKYPYGDQYCGVFSYAHQISGRIMLPVNLSTDDGPVYVNAKQYHGIIRRRQSRAKAEVLLSKMPKARKPYMHESRHLHAMRRPRGCGGRFLNTKVPKNDNKTNPLKRTNTPSPQSYEVLHSDSGGAHNLSNEGGANNSSSSNSNISGAEVTSMYSSANRNFNLFRIDHIAGMNMMDHVVPAPKWIGAGDHSCINLKA